VVGFRVPATVRIGDSAADLNLAVPVGTLDPSGRFVAFEQRRNLIGHDFLQATGAKLDFSRPHSHAFVEVDDVELLRITAEEDRALRAWARLNLRRAARKMGSGGARRKRGGPRHVYRRAAER
jgi:hypothetical protein